MKTTKDAEDTELSLEQQSKQALDKAPKEQDIEQKEVQKSYFKRVKDKFSSLKVQIRTNKFLILNILAVFVGVIGGIAAVIFRFLISALTFVFDFFLYVGIWIGPFWIPFGIFLMTSIGGLLVGILTTKFAPEAKGHGVPEIMEAVALEKGKIRPRVPIVKSIASAITIGSGGSAGREGPIGLIGGGSGSFIGQLLKFDEENTKVLTVCGVSSGIAATFNAPIGGALFGLEIVMMGIDPVAVIPVLISTVVGTAVASAILGTSLALPIPKYNLVFGPELLLFFVLGLLLGLMSVIWIRALGTTERVFNALPIPRFLKPALGGLIVGGIILFFPQTARVGYETLEIALMGGLLLGPLAVLALMKILATSLSIGSGGSGGVFAPSLFMGGLSGTAVGMMFHLFFPSMLTIPMAFGVVGMGALFAGAGRAPLTSTVMIAEMTGDYLLLLPLMTACATSYAVSSLIYKHSIYTEKLALRGIELKHQLIVDIIDTITVDKIMKTRDLVFVNPNLLAFQIIEIADNTKHSCLPVVDHDRLIGLVTFRQAHDALREGHPLEESTAKDIAMSPAPSIFPDSTVHEALNQMLIKGVNLLCVVERDNPSKLVGLLSREDILNAHNYEQIRRIRETQKGKNE
ncbi:MAG: chloride channel protein [Promethearchaeota archaeon]